MWKIGDEEYEVVEARTGLHANVDPVARDWRRQWWRMELDREVEPADGYEGPTGELRVSGVSVLRFTFDARLLDLPATRQPPPGVGSGRAFQQTPRESGSVEGGGPG